MENKIKIDVKIKDLINNSADKFNAISTQELSKVSTLIKELNSFIDGTLNLSSDGVEERLDYLIGYFALTLDYKIDNFSVLRARKFEEGRDKDPCFSTVKELSYAPSKFASLGRCNKDKESIFYGCLCWKDLVGGTETAFSEVRASKYERINVLKLESVVSINLRYIGIWDYVLRESKPYFMSDDLWDYYKSIHNYMKTIFNRDLFNSFLLCDAFFSDILCRKGSPKLYEVTSVLSNMFLEGGVADGILYASVENKGFPVIGLSTDSVDRKLKPISAVCYEIVEDYGYGKYKVKNLYDGIVDEKSGKINWKKNE